MKPQTEIVGSGWVYPLQHQFKISISTINLGVVAIYLLNIVATPTQPFCIMFAFNYQLTE